MTFPAFFNPVGLAALVLWNLGVLVAAQLTIRLIMRFSALETLWGALVLTAAALPVAAVYDGLTGPDPSFSTRLNAILVPMGLMAVAGFATARWVLRFKRLRGQVIAGGMVGLLAPHRFTLTLL